MNKMRRKEIYTIIGRLNVINDSMNIEDIIDEISDIIEELEMILSDEECYKDNIPENLQGGERYEKAEEACDNLQESIDTLGYIDNTDTIEYILENVEEATECLYNAI